MADYSTLSDEALLKLADKLKFDIAEYSMMEQTDKLRCNSCFGAIGNPYFRLYDIRVATSITMDGQSGAQNVEWSANAWLSKQTGIEKDYVVAMDTDSVHFTLGDLLKVKGLTNGKSPVEINSLVTSIVNDRMTPFINSATDKLASNRNTIGNRLQFKLEGIAQSAIYVAKKRYAQYLISSEGVLFSKPKLKIMGLAAARSESSTVIRDKLKDTYKVMLLEDEKTIQKHITDVEKWFFDQPFEVIAKNTSCNGLTKWAGSGSELYKKGCPGNARAVLLHNRLISDKNASEEIEPIVSGEKVKVLSLIPQNPTQEKAVAFVGTLPEQFGLGRYVDKEVLFEKVYLKPIGDMLETIGWKPIKTDSVFDLFG